MADHQIRALARRLRRLEKQALRQKQPGLGFSAIDDGAITSVDEDGALQMIMGKQFDGTQAVAVVNGPVPPTPTAPSATAAVEGAVVRWDGLFEDDAIVPMDFSRVEVHASIDPDFDAVYAETLVATFETPRGGQVYVSLVPGTYYIKLVARSLSGGRSEPSTGTMVEPQAISDLIPEGTDGVAPATSPTPEVVGGLNAFYVRWVPPANPDPMRFEVHVSATDDFTPDSTTLTGETSSYSMTVRTLTTIDDETGLPELFSYDTPYYFKIIAKDADGSAPASSQGSDTLYRITSPDIGAEQIYGEHIRFGSLTGDLFEGNLVLGSTISTGALDEEGNIVGARVDLGPSGLFNFDAAGEPIVKFPITTTEAAYVKAHMEMLSAEVRDNFTMYGTNNQIATEAELTLAAGVEPPTAPPVVSFEYDELQLDTETATAGQAWFDNMKMGTFSLNPSQIRSIDFEPLYNIYVVVQQRSDGFRIWRFKQSDGSLFNSLITGNPWVDDYKGYHDASLAVDTVNGGSVYIFRNGAGDWYAYGHTPTGDDAFNKIPAGWILETGGRTPVVAFDAINNRVMLCQNSGGGSGVFHVRRFTLNPGDNFPNATSTSTFQAESGSGRVRRVNGVVFGSQISGAGVNRYAWGVDDYLRVNVAGTDGVLRNDDGTFEEWDHPHSMLGFCHNGTQYAAVNSSGRITLYSSWNWAEANDTAHVAASAYDSVAGDGDLANPHPGQSAGQHETPVGTFSTFTQKRRAKMRITMPETNSSGFPNDADKWKVYFARQGTLPTDPADLDLVSAIGSPTSATSVTITADPTGGPPPGGIRGQVGAVNNFPGADPGRIESAGADGSGPIISLRGDGAGRTGGLTWDTDGYTVLNSNDVWHKVGDPGEPAWQNGFTQDSVRPLEFRKDPVGRVEIRGRANPGTAGATVFTLPAGYRPSAQLWNVTASAQNNTPCNVLVYTNGDVQINAFGTAGWISLNLTFTTL